VPSGTKRRVIGRKRGRGRTLEGSYRSSGLDGIQACACRDGLAIDLGGAMVSML
jgi:hypothetical protein